MAMFPWKSCCDMAIGSSRHTTLVKEVVDTIGVAVLCRPIQRINVVANARHLVVVFKVGIELIVPRPYDIFALPPPVATANSLQHREVAIECCNVGQVLIDITVCPQQLDDQMAKASLEGFMQQKHHADTKPVKVVIGTIDVVTIRVYRDTLLQKCCNLLLQLGCWGLNRHVWKCL